MKVRFDNRAFGWFIFWFAVEFLIAAFQFGAVIRSYLGDVFVVWLMYYAITALVSYSKKRIVLGVLVFSLFIEILQYFKVLKLLGLNHNRVLSIVVGSSFSWIDLLCYSVGAMVLWWMNRSEEA